jgi:peptidoglycan/LPS O-acetylase OafA/YrhL
MTQNFLAPTIFEINPIWSLNFEVLFYLLFIPLSLLRINIYLVSGICVSLGLVANIKTHYLIGGYCLGFTFWLCGVMLARNLHRLCAPSFSVMASMLLLLLSIRDYNVLTIWLSKAPYLLHHPDIFDVGPVRIIDLSSLPYCVLMVALFASLDFPYRKYLLPLLLLLPAIAIYKKLHALETLPDKTVIPPLIFYLGSLAIYFLRNPLEAACRRFIQRLASTGAWSYGLYIIHFPIIAIFARVEWFTGSAFTFSVRLLCYASLCFAASYLLEKKFQPWAKKLLY